MTSNVITNNDTAQSQEQNTMTSLRIAEITGKEHKNILRDIRKMELEIGKLKFEPTDFIDSQGKKQPMYILDESESLTLASGYNVKMRKAIIDDWLKLKESKPIIKKQSIEDTTEALALHVLDLIKANREKQKLIESQNDTNSKLLVAKAKDFKTNKELVKADIGKEINGLVNKYFFHLTGDHKEAHLLSHKEFQKETGIKYLGAKETSLETKTEYLKWLRTYKIKESDLLLG